MARGSISTITLHDSRLTKHVLKRMYFKGLVSMGGWEHTGVRAEKSWRERCRGDVRATDGKTEDRTLIYTRVQG